MSTGGFQFASGNRAKLLAIPKYLLSILFSWFVPRDARRWVFGSGAGIGEGALAVARELRSADREADITWLVADDSEAEAADAHGFTSVMRSSWAGYWATLRAGRIVVTHGLGDANRFGIPGGFVVQLWHGAPLKRLHLDSPVTTTVRGPALVRAILRKMYLAGSREVDLFVAGSPTAANRLRSAFRVAPGKVRVLGDPRDDALARQASDPIIAAEARAQLRELLGAVSDAEVCSTSDSATLIMYAPTWRDGEVDPAVPTAEDAVKIRELLAQIDAHLIIRSHPLGDGDYDSLIGGRIHRLGADVVRDITPLLGGVDLVITDYSSIALDFSLMGRPIVWFAPDLESYAGARGLYEPLEVTSDGQIDRTWNDVLARLSSLRQGSIMWRSAARTTRSLAARFHTRPEGGASARVLEEIERLTGPARDLINDRAVFFESFYGRQIACNPLAIDREIAARFPHATRYWSVTSETQAVPEGAVPLLVGGQAWHAARRYAKLLVVNDWLRFGFRRRRGQVVLQTWHGTMLKHLALGRPGVGLRTRLAIKRESRRWSLLLAQNPHSTAQFRASYAYHGEILESGYPRDDRLARAVAGEERNPVEVSRARAMIGVPRDVNVLVYAPTWRDGGLTLVDDLDVADLANQLGEGWVVVVRGHTRTHAFGSYRAADSRVIDASRHPDVNDVILAADLLITDYSSIMFDASIARVPLAFFVPDLPAYRDRERGFTFDFEREVPGPLLSERGDVVALAEAIAMDGLHAPWVQAHADAYAAWREKFVPCDDGHAATRVVDALVQRGAIPV